MTVLLLIAACTSDEATPGPPAPGHDDVPPLAEALAGCDVAPRPAAFPGDDLHRVTLTGTAARCNDGTAPILYVRAATDPVHAADWVLHLDGGGVCKTAEECAARWCGATPPYDASNMSGAWAPPASGAHGILSPDPENAFAGWNVVRAHYCSSDLWLGTAPDHVFDDADPPYRIAFQGDEIFGAILAAAASGLASDDGAASLPPLDEAERVVLSGASAGAWGAVVHASRVVAALPDAAVVIAADGAFSPAVEVLPDERRAQLVARFAAQWNEVAVPVWRVSPPEGCLDAHPGEGWRCADVPTLLRDHAAAPVALHHDLYDPVLFQLIAGIGTLDEAAVWAAATVDLLREEHTDASLHVSACARHTVVDQDDGFHGVRVVDHVLGPPALSYHDAVARTADGDRALAVDGVDGQGSTCR